jgi:hypothetical protein
MRIKNLFIAFIGLIILISLILSSCRTTNNVVSSNLVQKRKYNKGFYIKQFSLLTKAINLQPKVIGEKINSASLQEDKKDIPVLLNIFNKEIQARNSSETHESANNIAYTVQEQKGNKPDRTMLSDCNNFEENDIISKDEIINNSIPINYLNSFSIGKPNDKTKVNGMALVGFICSLLSVPLLFWGLTLGGTFYLPMGIICLVGAAILSIIGYKSIKKGQSKGKWFAIAGLALEILVAAFILFYLLILPQISLLG